MAATKDDKRWANINEDLYRDNPNNPNKILAFALPIPLSVNHMYRNTRGGGKTPNKKALDYIRTSRAVMNVAIEEQNWTMVEGHRWYYLDITFYMPDRIIRDSHNGLKILLDAMQGVVYENDYYIMPRIQGVEYDKENPRIEVRVTAQKDIDRKRAISMSK